MNAMTPMTAITIPPLPESAPFTPAQRAWLNGFFAGLLGGQRIDAASPIAAPTTVPATAPAEDFPWHDAALTLDERQALARNRPLPRQLMAAMAQLDCGQCGYQCQSYAEALATRAETSPSKCVPGGKETARALKALLAAAPAAAAPAAPTSPAATSGRSAIGPVRFDGAARLTGAASDKDTRHVVLKLNGSGLRYEAGDSVGLHVANCPDLVAAVAAALGAALDRPVRLNDGRTLPLATALGDALDIARPSDEAIELLARVARDRDEATLLDAIARGEENVEPVDPDLLDLLLAFPSARPSPDDLVHALSPLQPRLYSIASSPKAHDGEIHLTVGVVRYARNGRGRKGVASTFLAERAAAGSDLDAFIQTAHGFRLPARGDTPIIMIGPGTGIAPFRGFLAERRACGASGRNWLFFGEQRSAQDFLYRDQLESWRSDGLLSRLDLAFSRDQSDKVYVQHRMHENGADLWSWLQDGAHLYVCGDAKRMARDVDAALIDIAAREGGLSPADAKAYVAALARDHRYQRDVY